MIPPNIEASHILQAIERVNKEGYNQRREAADYDLYFKGNRYPPKVIISYANIFANGTELPSTSFGGGPETNKFLIERGYPILQNERKNPEGFFTVEELLFFDRYANLPYDHNDPISGNAGDFIATYIWGRSRNWADRITEVTDFKIEGKISWNEQRNNTHGQAFKPYSWYRLHHGHYYHEKIFYTVGVDGPPLNGSERSRLLIKLDYYRSKMTREQQDGFDNLLAARGVERLFIELPGDELRWERIIDLSIQYIDSTFQAYLAAIELAEGTAEVAVRITWNSQGWTKPSGRIGKSSSAADTHEKRHGYTPEEWLFDFEKIIDGYHYARLEAVNAGHHIGKVYRLTLFALEATQKRWFWIAAIGNAEVISPETSGKISEQYRREKWLEEQYGQLDAIVDVGSAKYKDMEDTARFNVRFRPEDVVMYDYEPFEEGEQPPSNHYNLPRLKKRPAFQTTSDDGRAVSIEFGSETENHLWGR